MPSPFPGMNPYLEQEDAWRDFHEAFLPTAREALCPQVSPALLVKLATTAGRGRRCPTTMRPGRGRWLRRPRASRSTIASGSLSQPPRTGDPHGTT
jgi:hypothetical protein